MIAYPEWIDGPKPVGILSATIEYDVVTDSITILENYKHFHRMSKVKLWELESTLE